MSSSGQPRSRRSRYETYPAPQITPRSVIARLRRLKERIFSSSTSPLDAYRSYVSTLLSAARLLDALCPQSSLDLQAILNSMFVQRFGIEWRFGNFVDEPVEKVVGEAVSEIYEELRRDRERLKGRVVSEASLRAEIEVEILEVVSKALETLLIKYAFPP